MVGCCTANIDTIGLHGGGDTGNTGLELRCRLVERLVPQGRKIVRKLGHALGQLYDIICRHARRVRHFVERSVGTLHLRRVKHHGASHALYFFGSSSYSRSHGDTVSGEIAEQVFTLDAGCLFGFCHITQRRCKCSVEQVVRFGIVGSHIEPLLSAHAERTDNHSHGSDRRAGAEEVPTGRVSAFRRTVKGSL